MPQAGVQTYETPSQSSNSDWVDKVEIAALRDTLAWGASMPKLLKSMLFHRKEQLNQNIAQVARIHIYKQ